MEVFPIFSEKIVKILLTKDDSKDIITKLISETPEVN